MGEYNTTYTETFLPINSMVNNTSTINILEDKIILTLILEPQTHFYKDSYTYFKADFNLDDFPELNGTVFNNTFSQSSVSDTPDLLHDSGNPALLKRSKLFDVYIECFTTFNCVYNDTKDTMGFKLHIKDAKMNTKSNLLSDEEMLIPNVSRPSINPTTVRHKAKKSSYVTIATLDKVTRIVGSISTLDGSTIFRNPTDTSNTDRLILEFNLIPRSY